MTFEKDTIIDTMSIVNVYKAMTVSKFYTFYILLAGL